MTNYEKPVVLVKDELAEGVYTASGSNCYAITTNIHQKPEGGRGDFRVQVDTYHNTDHHATAQILQISFNQNVTYVSSNGVLLSGDGTNTLYISYTYHSNEIDDVGFGDVVVVADQGLAVTGASFSCNEECGQHDHL